MQPFLKWAGGKRWLVNNYADLFPIKFNKYFEPFLGSGAVYFHLEPKIAVISDKNVILVETYNAIKKNWLKVYGHLLNHHKNHTKDYYYNIRKIKYASIYQKAAQFIYLNRTCWNGLYRVNLNGQFNVPKGTKDKVLFEFDRFDNVSTILQNTEIINKDFEEVINMAVDGDFVFIDPPYTVKHNNNGFIKYNEALFTWDDQVRLSNCVKEAVKRNVKVLITNADHSSVRSLYNSNFFIKSIERNSIISGNSKFRLPCKELIIRSKNA